MLEVFRDTGIPLSVELMKKQLSGANADSPFDMCLFWLTCDENVHKKRLRVSDYLLLLDFTSNEAG